MPDFAIFSLTRVQKCAVGFVIWDMSETVTILVISKFSTDKSSHSGVESYDEKSDPDGTFITPIQVEIIIGNIRI